MSRSRVLRHRDEHALKVIYSLMFLRGNLGSPQLWAANFILGTEYKRKCKETFLIVEVGLLPRFYERYPTSLQDASNRAVNDTLMAQTDEAIGESWFTHLFRALELILMCIFEVILNPPAIPLSILAVPRY
jgi:hypothetical protein